MSLNWDLFDVFSYDDTEVIHFGERETVELKASSLYQEH